MKKILFLLMLFGIVFGQTSSFTADYMTSAISDSCKTIKIHRVTKQDTVTTNSWTNCSHFQMFSGETSTSYFTLSADSTAITIIKAGMYLFGGCVHFQNNSGGEKTPLVASRVTQDGVEMKCSQRAWNGTVRNGGEGVLSYVGTAYLDVGEAIRLQYYTDDVTIELVSNAVFSNDVAYTLWLIWQGE